MFCSVPFAVWRHLSDTKTVDRYSVCMWSSLLMRIQMTCIAWVQFFKSRGEKRTDPVKNRGSLSLYNLVHLTNSGSPFVRCFDCNKPKVKLCTALTTQNTTANKCFVSRAQNTTALQSNVFITGIYRLAVKNQGRIGWPSANHSQGQIQTPWSVTSRKFWAVWWLMSSRRVTVYLSSYHEPSPVTMDVW
jgi:hypothetical protein